MRRHALIYVTILSVIMAVQNQPALAWPNFTSYCSCHSFSGVTTSASVETLEVAPGNTSSNFTITITGSGYHSGTTGSAVFLPSGWSADVDFSDSSGQWFWTNSVPDPTHNYVFNANITVPSGAPLGEQTIIIWGAGCNSSSKKASSSDSVKVIVSATGVAENGLFSTPSSFQLLQNFPNPFNPATNIPFTVYGSQFTVHSPIPTTLSIFNILGQKVRTLVDERKLPGDYQVVWNGKDDNGNEVPSGIYFYQLKIGDFKQSKSMLLLR